MTTRTAPYSFLFLLAAAFLLLCQPLYARSAWEIAKGTSSHNSTSEKKAGWLDKYIKDPNNSEKKATRKPKQSFLDSALDKHYSSIRQRQTASTEASKKEDFTPFDTSLLRRNESGNIPVLNGMFDADGRHRGYLKRMFMLDDSKAAIVYDSKTDSDYLYKHAGGKKWYRYKVSNSGLFTGEFVGTLEEVEKRDEKGLNRSSYQLYDTSGMPTEIMHQILDKRTKN